MADPKQECQDDTYTPDETAARAEAALKRMLATPHKPHKPHKPVGKPGPSKPDPDRSRQKPD